MLFTSLCDVQFPVVILAHFHCTWNIFCSFRSEMQLQTVLSCVFKRHLVIRYNQVMIKIWFSKISSPIQPAICTLNNVTLLELRTILYTSCNLICWNMSICVCLTYLQFTCSKLMPTNEPTIANYSIANFQTLDFSLIFHHVGSKFGVDSSCLFFYLYRQRFL